MGAHERWTALLDILGRDGRLDVGSASAALSVSPATIRRDLDHLASQQLLTRTRGGAAPAAIAYDLPLRHKSSRFSEQKLRIGTAAAALIPPGAVVGLNGRIETTGEASVIDVRSANGIITSGQIIAHGAESRISPGTDTLRSSRIPAQSARRAPGRPRRRAFR